jgi:hypothetical protein
VLELNFERTAQEVKEQFKHVPNALPLKEIELNGAETPRAHFRRVEGEGHGPPYGHRESRATSKRPLHPAPWLICGVPPAPPQQNVT